MKINERISLGAAKNEIFGKTGRKVLTVSSGFGNLLKESKQENAYQYLNELRQKIEKQGEKLAKTIDMSDLRYYKKMISEFLAIALDAACRFEREDIIDRRGRRHVYSLVTKVNRKVEELVRQVMDKEKDHIAILKTIHDIRGLLVDLSM